jgi:hypothetical protein
MCAGSLAGCGKKHHEPIDTSKVFSVKKTFGDGFQTKTKGPKDIDQKMLQPEKLPDTVTFDPPECRDFVTSGRLPQGTTGRMSVVAAEGEGNRFTAIAVQAEKDVPYDADTAKKCAHVTFEAGKLTGYVDEVEAPKIDGATTVGSHRQIEIALPEGQRSTEVYSYTAYLGDWLVLVTAGPQQIKGQEAAPVDTDRARQLLTDAVNALRD